MFIETKVDLFISLNISSVQLRIVFDVFVKTRTCSNCPRSVLKLFEHLMTLPHTRERERDVLFNDALNTFYLLLYGVRHMVKDHSDSEKGNPLPPHRLLLSINSKGSFICTIPQT